MTDNNFAGFEEQFDQDESLKYRDVTGRGGEIFGKIRDLLALVHPDLEMAIEEGQAPFGVYMLSNGTSFTIFHDRHDVWMHLQWPHEEEPDGPA